MGKYVNTGNFGFTKYVNGEYVDKTELIAFINSTLNTANMLTCVTRPRRFGKSIAANMLYAYYDQSCDSSKLFDSLKISRDTSYHIHLNKYPTIFVDITSFITRYKRRKDIVKILQKDVKEDILEAYPDVKVRKNYGLMEVLISFVEKYGRQFIFIIDEWDALCRELSDTPSLMDEYITLLRRMFKTAETAKVFAGVYMTGILPIKKYGTQSALNDFCEYSMTSPGAIGSMLGFNDNDVRMLSQKYSMDFLELKYWYDGYRLLCSDWRNTNLEVHEVSIYNPNSVMKAVANGFCDNYWSKSESFETLQQYIDMDFDDVKETLDNLVKGNKVHLKAMRFGNDISSIQSNEELFTLLTHFGYLSYNANTKEAMLPNQEVREEFVEALRGSKSHVELSKMVKISDKLLEATWQMDEDSVAEGINDIHNHKTSPNFYNNEQALRSVIRTAYLGAIDYYVEIQELPSGKGYADLVFLPRKNCGKPAMVIELKWNESVNAAIHQIKVRNYPDILSGFKGEILLVGINYDSKTKLHTCKIDKIISR